MLISIQPEDRAQSEARLKNHCVCGKDKEAGQHSQIVCWTCWREGFKGLGYEPFKYFQGSYSQWLKRLKELNLI